MRRRYVAGLLALALTGSSNVSADDSTTVNCGGKGVSLQRAIDEAAVGSTLVVRGTCETDGLFVRKDLQIVAGTGGAVISTTSDRVIHVSGSAVTIRGITVNAQNAAFGILVEEGSSVYVDETTVENAAGGFGISVSLNSYASITASTVRDSLYGVFVSESSSIWMVDTRIERSGHQGVGIFTTSTAQIINSFITNGNTGVYVERLSNATIQNTQITNNTGPGIWLTPFYAVANLRPELNTIENNGVDVQCDERGILQIDATQTSATKAIAIHPGCVVIGAPLF